MSTHPDSPLVRPAVAGDLDALLALEAASFSADRLSRRQYRYHLSNPAATLLVAVQERALAGAAMLLFRRDSPAARLYSLAVDPACRGHGVGRALLDACEARARSRGCRRLRLEVRTDNTAARELYQRQGYRSVGQRRGYYVDGAAAVCMEKTLAD